MSEAIQINLSRALKLKNRLVHRISQLDSTIQTSNSTLEENQDYDIRELYKSRSKLVDLLIDLKTTINTTNQPIQRMIFQLAESKSLISLLNKMSTKHGASLEGYASVRAVYVAQIRKPEVDREVKRIEQEIDRLQDELDRYNYRTMITIDRAMLDDEEPEPVPPYEL